MTIRRSSSERPSGSFQVATSAVILISWGIQWLAQPSMYFCQAQSYLKGTNWFRSARQLIMAFSSTLTRAAPISSSSRPGATSIWSMADFARSTFSAMMAAASASAATPLLMSLPGGATAGSGCGVAVSATTAGCALGTAGAMASSVLYSSQLSIVCSPQFNVVGYY